METKMLGSEVIIVPYDKEWPNIFSIEAQKLRKALGEHIGNVYHIGSTSVVDLAAKPIIDIIVELQPNVDQFVIQTALLDLGYSFLLPNIIPKFSFLSRKYLKTIGFHLHLFPVNDHEVKRHLLFRDHLNADRTFAQEYAKLKENLSVKYRYDRFAYTANKTNLVKLIDNRARRWAFEHEYYQDFYQNSIKLSINVNKNQILEALQANLSFKLCYFAMYLEYVDFIRVPGATTINTNLKTEQLNYIIDAHINSKENVADKIKEITSKLTHKNIPFIWQVAPRDLPNNLEKYLLQAKFTVKEELSGMYLDLKAWQENQSKVIQEEAQDKLHIVRVIDKAQALAYAQINNDNNAELNNYYLQCANLPLQKDDLVQMYLGYANGMPIVRCCVALNSGVVGIYEIEGFEHRETYLKELLFALFKQVLALGFEIAVIHSQDLQEEFFNKIGFISCCKFKKFKLQ